jgi:hypothetical protein
MEEFAYGRWCTVAGQRWMILDASKWTVEVYDATEKRIRRFDKSVVSEVSDFLLTDAERAALGYAF